MINIFLDPYQQYNLANGLLVGPGGPTGVLGRPYGRFPYAGGAGGFGGYPNQQFGGGGHFPGQQFGNFEGQHNGIGFNPAFAGGAGNFNPAFGGGAGFGGPFNQQFGPAQFPGAGLGQGQRPFYDSTNQNSAIKNKIEKSVEWAAKSL